MINQGKLAVILGIEVSKLFDCGLNNEQAECTAPQIDQRLDEVYDMGVRDMELVNKFDNALAGVAGDSGTTGVVVNNGNKIETGKYWQMTSCDGHNHVEDRTQYSLPGVERDSLAGNVLRVFGTSGAAPIYPPAPHCNVRGLSPLGAHLVQADDRQEDDRRPRPPERARAQPAARHRRGGEATPGSSPATPGARRTRSRGSTGSAASSRRTRARRRTS